MKKFRIIAATTLVGTALVAGATLPASAATHSGSVPAGTYNYADGTDTYCVTNGGPGKRISVRLSPVTAGRGPTTYVNSDAALSGSRAKACVSLARAYEDTRYKAVVSSWVSGRYTESVYYFYS